MRKKWLWLVVGTGVLTSIVWSGLQTQIAMTQAAALQLTEAAGSARAAKVVPTFLATLTIWRQPDVVL